MSLSKPSVHHYRRQEIFCNYTPTSQFIPLIVASVVWFAACPLLEWTTYTNWTPKIKTFHTIIIIMSILPKGKYFTANLGIKAAVLLKGRSSTANSGTQAAVLLGMDRCGSFPLLSAPHPLFIIWTYLKRTEKIPGAPTWRWGEWVWLTGLSGLHRNSPQGLNISFIRVFDQIRDPEIPITLRPLTQS